MLYRLAQALNASYGLAVAWGYIGMFAVACMLLFVFPQITLLLLFLGLASLGLTITCGWLIDSITRAIARRALHADRCPRCSTPSAEHIRNDEAWICDHCGSEFKIGGGEMNERERARYIETPSDDLPHAMHHDDVDDCDAWQAASR